MYRSVVGMLIGTMPAFATWMGLWWSQYPAERALREQNLLVELDNESPLYQPPRFRSYFFSNFRLQVLFTLLPVALIVLVRDGLIWGALLDEGDPDFHGTLLRWGSKWGHRSWPRAWSLSSRRWCCAAC